MSNLYQCPVCFYPGMIEPPEYFNICPCCGTEFGYHDSRHTHAQLREEWVKKGCPWFSQATRAPADLSFVQRAINLVDPIRRG